MIACFTHRQLCTFSHVFPHAQGWPNRWAMWVIAQSPVVRRAASECCKLMGLGCRVGVRAGEPMGGAPGHPYRASRLALGPPFLRARAVDTHLLSSAGWSGAVWLGQPPGSETPPCVAQPGSLSKTLASLISHLEVSLCHDAYKPLLPAIGYVWNHLQLMSPQILLTNASSSISTITLSFHPHTLSFVCLVTCCALQKPQITCGPPCNLYCASQR